MAGMVVAGVLGYIFVGGLLRQSTDFNRSFANEKNPITGNDLTSGKKPIWVPGQSGSMAENDEIGRAKEAVKTFVDDQSSKNNVALVEFNTKVTTLVPLDSVELNRQTILDKTALLNGNGNTAVHDALSSSTTALNKTADNNRIQAIVLQIDGQDTTSVVHINDIVRAITNARNGSAPVLDIPVAYGKDADVNVLGRIARASDTNVQSGDPATIKKLPTIIGRYF